MKDASEEVADIEEETKNLKPSYWKVQFTLLLECAHDIIYVFSASALTTQLARPQSVVTLVDKINMETPFSKQSLYWQFVATVVGHDKAVSACC